MVKAIVTGAAGFIGSHLCRRLLQEHVHVVGIDSMTDYYDVRLKRMRVRELSLDRRFTFAEQCLTKDLAPSVWDGAEYLFHLAGQPGVRSCWGTAFAEYTLNNITAAQRLLESAARHGSRLRMSVYASTSSVYGDGCGGSLTEEAMPSPLSPYAVTKLAGEHLFRLYGSQYSLPSVIVRYFSVYGPDQRPDMAFHKLCRALRYGESFTLYGGGEQSRDFTYVEDIVQGTVLAASKGASGDTYNLGSGRGVTMKRALACLEQQAGKKLHPRMEPLQAGEMKHTLADISKARRELGYEPSTGLEEGLAMQWEAYCRVNRFAV